MDKFVIRKALTKSKRTLVDEDAGCSNAGSPIEDLTEKKRRTEKADSSLEQTYSWKRIRAENLSCDYTSLFNKAEANELFQQLEKDIVYFTGDLAKVQVYGKWHSVPRKQVTFGDEGLTYTFSGITLSPKPWVPVLNLIRDRVYMGTGHTFNFVLINRIINHLPRGVTEARTGNCTSREGVHLHFIFCTWYRGRQPQKDDLCLHEWWPPIS